MKLIKRIISVEKANKAKANKNLKILRPCFVSQDYQECIMYFKTSHGYDISLFILHCYTDRFDNHDITDIEMYLMSLKLADLF